MPKNTTNQPTNKPTSFIQQYNRFKLAEKNSESKTQDRPQWCHGLLNEKKKKKKRISRRKILYLYNFHLLSFKIYFLKKKFSIEITNLLDKESLK